MNTIALKLFDQSSDLLNRLSDFRDTFTRYTPEWFRADNIHAKAFKRYLRRYDWAFSYNPFKTLYAPQLTESGDSARSSVPVVALPGTGSHQQEGQGSNLDFYLNKFKFGRLPWWRCPSISSFHSHLIRRLNRRKFERWRIENPKEVIASTPDVRHVEYFDDVEIIHHVICYTVPQAFERV